MDRRTFMKLLGGLASMPIVGRIAKPLKSETVQEGIASVSEGGMKLYEMVVSKVIKEGKKIGESGRVDSYKHPDRPDITVDVNQTDGSAEIYFDTDKGSKGYAKIDRDMETGGTDLQEAEEIFTVDGDKDVQEGIMGGIENLDEFTRIKKAMGGRIEYQTGGRATTADYAAALAKVGAGTQAQKNKSLTEYAQNKAAEDIRNAIKSGGQQGLQSFVQGQLGSGIVPGLKGITSPQSGIANFAQQNLINALAKNYTSQQSGYTYSPGTFVQSGGGGLFGQVANLAAGEGVFGQVKDNTGNMAYGVRLFGKYYPSEEAAIKDLGIERYNTVMADGGRVTKADGGSVDLTIITMPDINESGVESLFKTR